MIHASAMFLSSIFRGVLHAKKRLRKDLVDKKSRKRPYFSRRVKGDKPISLGPRVFAFACSLVRLFSRAMLISVFFFRFRPAFLQAQESYQLTSVGNSPNSFLFVYFVLISGLKDRTSKIEAN